MNKLLIGGIVFFIIIIIITLVYYFFRSSRFTCILCKPTHFIDDFNMFISNLKLPLSKTGNMFSYSFDIKFLNLPENSQWHTNVNYKKPILFRFGSPNVNYYPLTHTLQIEMSYKDKLGEINYHKLNINNLEIQKWINIVIVLENRNIDVYLNKQRYISSYLPNVPFIFNKNLYLGEKKNNFNGYLDNVKYFNYALNEAQIISSV